MTVEEFIFLYSFFGCAIAVLILKIVFMPEYTQYDIITTIGTTASICYGVMLLCVAALTCR